MLYKDEETKEARDWTQCYVKAELAGAQVSQSRPPTAQLQPSWVLERSRAGGQKLGVKWKCLIS